MKNFIITVLIITCIFNVSSAQNIESSEKNLVGVTGMLTNSDTWQLDFSYHYMLCNYVGVGSSIGMWKQYNVCGLPKGDGWRIDEDYEKCSSFFLRPSIYLKSPVIAKIDEGDLCFSLEPGFMMNIPYNRVSIDILNETGHVTSTQTVSSNKGRWYAFDIKAALCYNIADVGICIGYEYSNLDIFSYRRNMVYHGKHFSNFYDTKKSVHGVFVSFNYSF